MTPIVITVLLLSVAAVSSVSIHRNGTKKMESVSAKIEKANANVNPGNLTYNLTYGDIIEHISDEEGILRDATPCFIIGCKWPKTGKEVIIPYEISRNFTKRLKRFIKDTLREFSSGERTTCIRFVRKTEIDINYLSFVSQNGCRSNLGQIGGGQIIDLKRDKCMRKNIVQHEVLHALGFHHEHVRYDRNDYVTIKYENIKPGAKKNFDIAPTNNMGAPYDYDSVMHYNAFSASKNGQPTIVAKYRSITHFGITTEMSDNDYARLNRLYEC
ncbi:low choriolytic enzyme-like isoform X1 [Syngnathus scovelli]|uniref:low choriolytic enzyme-like isoform X1 n=1 Tax=Syngnathus scovelli TaxID=161590 RepID=UPI0021105DFA|nr:low choriolytic enzyme-like isoform X2 [Syngnathus scovelli]